jgi:hypothetical protein
MSDTSTTSTALRQVADLLDAHPDLPQPTVTVYPSGRASLDWVLSVWVSSDLAEQRAAATSIVRAFDGHWDKTAGGSDAFYLKQTRDDGIRLCIIVERSAVCERVVTGTETRTVPAKPAEPERTETVETVEWVCGPLLKDEPAAVSA